MTAMLDTILKVIIAAGKIAVSKQSGIDSISKADKSPVTAVDLELSALIGQAIKPFTDLDNHMVVDEEVEQSVKDQWNSFRQAKFSWFIDPISGTMMYLNGLPLYGISIGVLRNGKPYTGAVYLPALEELYWHSEGKAYFQYKDNKAMELDINTNKVTPFSIFFINLHQRFTLSEKVSKTASFLAVNPGFLWSATGRFSGTLVKLKVWDMAAAWGICNAVGLDFYGLDDGRKIEHVSELDFDETWKMRQPMIMTNVNSIDILRRNIMPVI